MKRSGGDSLSRIFRDALLPGPIALPDEDVAEHAAIHEAIERTGIRPDSWQLADADFYSIYEEDGKFYLNAGGSVRGPFQTRAEAVMAKKTSDAETKCPRCKGSGSIMVRGMNRPEQCPTCKGTGKVETKDSLSSIARDAILGDCWWAIGQEKAPREYAKYSGGDSLSAIAKDALRGDGWNYVVSNNKGDYVEKAFPHSDEGMRDAYAFAARNKMAVWEAHNGRPRYLLRSGSADALTDLIERATSGLREQTGDAGETAKTKKIWKDLEDGKISRGEAIKRLRAEGLSLDYIRAMLDG